MLCHVCVAGAAKGEAATTEEATATDCRKERELESDEAALSSLSFTVGFASNLGKFVPSLELIPTESAGFLRERAEILDEPPCSAESAAFPADFGYSSAE